MFLLNKYECLHIFPVPLTMTAKLREAWPDLASQQ